MSSVLPWSWTSYNDYNTCPRRFYEVRLAKNFTEPGGEYLEWGKEVHKAFELGIGHNVPMPANMKQWEHIRVQLVNSPGEKYVEQKTAVDANFKACEFFDKGGYNRGVDDYVGIHGSKGLSIDWKTGKKGKFSLQLALSAARLFAKFEQLSVITTAYFWTQTNEWTKAVYHRTDIPGIWEAVREGVHQMQWSEENNAWPAKPSGLCKKSRKPGSSYMGCPVKTCPHSEGYGRG